MAHDELRRNLTQSTDSTKGTGLIRHDYSSTFCTKTLTKKLIFLDETTLKYEIEQYRQQNNKAICNIVDSLLSQAESALTRGPYSVTDKTAIAPSQKKNDYFTIAPYFWPNPNSSDGLPYISIDGKRVPGTKLYEPESDRYDRTRIQYLFDDSLISVLAWCFSGNKKYAEHAANLLNVFFLDPNTRMNPHLEFAQVRRGHNDDKGFRTGIIELKDFYFYLDAVRILDEFGFLNDTQTGKFEEWVSEYLGWLLKSIQGQEEAEADNNHGTYYDLQVASLASFLNQTETLDQTFERSINRILQQISFDGSQPKELKRTLSKHYCCFNLQGWSRLCTLSSRYDFDLFGYQSKKGKSLTKAFSWFINKCSEPWEHKQIEEYDNDRVYPLIIFLDAELDHFGNRDSFKESAFEIKPIFFPHDGVQPFWNLSAKRLTKKYVLNRILLSQNETKTPSTALLDIL